MAKHVEPWRSSLNKVWSCYRYEAKKRNLPFLLTPKAFKQLIDSRCFYCNAPPSNIAKHEKGRQSYVYSGIDRLDNTQGYTPDNCVPCCVICNKMKHKMSFNFFIDQLAAIVYNLRINLEECNDDDESEGNPPDTGRESLPDRKNRKAA